MMLRCGRPPEIQCRVERLKSGKVLHLIYSNHTQTLLSVGEDFYRLWRMLGGGEAVPAVVERVARERGLSRAEAAAAVRTVLEACRKHRLLEPAAAPVFTRAQAPMEAASATS
jgi:hypothetical protein